MQQKSIRKNIINWGILVLLGLTWGSSFILMKKGLQVFSALEVAGMRIVTAAILLLPWSLQHLKQLERRYYGYLLLSGLTGTLGPIWLLAQAQTQLDSAVIGVMNALAPIFVLLIGRLCFQQPIVRGELLGALLGLVGVFLLLFFGESHGATLSNYQAFLPLVACVLYGFNINLINHRLQGAPATAIASISFLFIGVITGLALFVKAPFLYKLQTVEGAYRAAGFIAFLGVWGTASAQLLWVILIQHSSPVFASMIAFIIPVVALGWGLLDGEV